MKPTGGWEFKRIDEAGQVQAGRQRSPHHVSGPLRPYLRVANVFEGYIDTSDVLEMSFKDDEFKRYVLRPGDVLLNEGQSLELVGRSAVYRGVPEGCCFQNTLIRFRANDATDPEYAHYLFEHLRAMGAFSKIAVQTTSIAHLGVDRFGSLKVWWPPLDEQRRIASIVRCWDQAVSMREQQIASARRANEWLSGHLLNGIRRFPEFEGSPWSDVTLGEITEESSERNTMKLGAASVRGVNKTLGMIPMRERTIGSDLGRYKTVLRDWFAYNPMRLNIGSLSRWEEDEPVLVSPDYVVFRCNPDRLLPDYFDHLRRSRLWERFVTVSGNGSVRVRIYYGDIASLKLSLPDLTEQRKIAAVLSEASREVSLLERLVSALRTQKAGIVGKLVSGPPARKESAA